MEIINYLAEEQKAELNISVPIFWIFLIGSLISILFSSFVILTYVRIKECRNQPGDIFLMISVSDLFLCFHWLLTALYSRANPFNNRENDPASNTLFCQINARISILAGQGQFFYNVCFCLYIIFSIKYALKERTLSKFLYHIITCGLSVAILFILVAAKNVGKSEQGTCSQKNNGLTIMPIMLFILFSQYTLRYYKNKLPNEKRYFVDKVRTLKHYKKYINLVSINYMILGVSWLGSSLIYHQTLQLGDHQPFILNIFVFINNVGKMSSSLLVTFIRIQDPFLKNKIKLAIFGSFISEEDSYKLFRKAIRPMGINKLVQRKKLSLTNSIIASIQYFYKIQLHYYLCKKFNIEVKINNSTLLENLFNQGYGQINKFDEYTLSPSENKNKAQDSRLDSFGGNTFRQNVSGFLDTLTFNTQYNTIRSDSLFQKNKGNQIEIQDLKSVLPQDNKENLLNRDFTIEKKDFIEIYQFKFVHEIVKQEITLNTDVNCLIAKIDVFAPSVFAKIQKSMNCLDILKSLHLQKNKKSIRKAGQGEGKGGEFLFFSYDNQLIIKTIDFKEFQFFKDHLQEYYEYLSANPKSLIAKILGVYTIKFDVEEQPQTVILMENLSKVHHDCILASYDLKGSTHSREVMKGQDILVKTRQTLKDIDFTKREKQMVVSKDVKQQLIEQIQKDAKFFQSIGVIDYSMIVFKVDRSKNQMHQNLINSYGYAPQNTLKQIESLETESYNKQIYWHMGIIDYFQNWNVLKQTERWIKIVKSWGQDPSSNAPQPYAKRFVDFLFKGLKYPGQ